MTPEQLNDALRDVAIYDGWVRKKALTDTYFFYQKNGKVELIQTLPYHTSYDWLMPVAKNVCNELADLSTKDTYTSEEALTNVRCNGAINDIRISLFCDISVMFEKVLAATQLLTKYKATK